VIISCSTSDFFFDFREHPFFKALNMNIFTTSRAFTWAEKEIVWR
jgi:hypothetical protein